MTSRIVNEPAEQYHANTASVSRGMLWTLRESPREFHWRYILRQEAEEPGSDAMKIGTIGHAVLLEGKSIDECCVTIPDEVLSSSGSRAGAAWKAFEAEHAGMVLLKKDQVDDTKAMAEAVLAHEHVGAWHKAASRREVSIYWEDELTGVSCRCRPDWLIEFPDRVLVIDLKTTIDTRRHKFARAAREHGYHIQEAHYTNGVEEAFGKPVDWIFVVAKRKPGFTCCTYTFDDATRSRAMQQYRGLMFDLAARLDSGDWRDAEERNDNTITIPDYEFTNTEESYV